MASRYGKAQSTPQQAVDQAAADVPLGGEPMGGYDPAMHQYWQRQAEENMNAVHMLKNGAPFQPSPSAPDRQALMKRMLEDAQHAQWQADYYDQLKTAQTKQSITQKAAQPTTAEDVAAVLGSR